MKQYDEYTDEQLVQMIRQNSSQADDMMDYIMEKYKPLVRKRANAMFLIGGETEDLIQEGMIGLFKAIRDYREDQGCMFGHFAEVCVNRQVCTALTASNRKKHAPLNSYVSFSADEGENEGLIEELLGGGNESENPERMIIEQEIWQEFRQNLWKELSTMEQQVLTRYLDGLSYTEIAQKMEKTPKSIDNALQRIRQKIGNMKAGE